ncbi:AAA family ATPase [Salinimicrobium sp. WS361]|uniref:AAA family ATPase n=1 Tax=Salinimicrobium sp. WS361 TaxID=3425123 RepID=UPI003D6DABB7
MNYGNKTEPQFLPEFNLTFIIDRWGSLNPELLYTGYYGTIASQQTFSNVDMKKFYREFPVRFQKNILGHHFKKNDSVEEWKCDYSYVLEDEIVVYKDNDEITVFFNKEDHELLKDTFSFTNSLKIAEDKGARINLIISQPHGLDNKKIKFAKPELDLKEVYNDDFTEYHKKIFSILEENDRSGLHLLYGKPGTGKSTYLKYLCGILNKEITFLPGQMAQNLDNVAMTRYLIKNPNCVLIIEDAEELIVSRDHQRNSNLAMILNITDGILGESLGIQIIATFNTDVKNIDPALKRKGRLKSAYEFKPLSPEKANALLREQNTDYYASKEMTLAEIYNISEEEQYKSPQRKAVGFR